MTVNFKSNVKFIAALCVKSLSRPCFLTHEVRVGLGRYNDLKLNFFFSIRFNHLILHCNANLYSHDI